MNLQKQPLILIATLSVGLLLGRACFTKEQKQPTLESESSEKATAWTCSMHPQIQQPHPGDCPLCGMDLIPMQNSTEDELGPRELKLSERAERLAEVEVAVVERRFVTHPIRLVGKIEMDETRITTISSWVSGRLERLYVDYTGINVKKDDHLLTLYSPALTSAQEELLQLSQTVNQLKGSSNTARLDRARNALDAVRTKLELLGLKSEQIQDIENKGTLNEYITIYSPLSGVVIQKNAAEGQYVKTGTPIYTVADLSIVWLKLDAHESDLAWLHFGQDVTFRVEAYPGEVFQGKIAFIDPILNPKTRTVKLRVNVPNNDRRLKPEMFVRAEVSAKIALGGNVFSSELAGKWISPMHPEIIKDAPGNCDICGMDLVSAESLGYVLNASQKPPLIIPATAALITGKRAVVYIRKSKGHYEGRDITLGPRAGDYYLVSKGLSEGEQVVVRGNFKMDSALQIMGKKSMMSPQSIQPFKEDQHHHPQASTNEALPNLARLMPLYFKLQEALSNDKLPPAKAALKEMMTIVEHEGKLANLIHDMRAATTLDAIRRPHFDQLSTRLIASLKAQPEQLKEPAYLMNCSMVYPDHGADWIQRNDDLRNPYFGAKMLHCGSSKQVLGGKK